MITGERREVLDREERIARAAAFTARHVAGEFETAAVLDLHKVRMYAARGLIGPGIEGERDIDAVVRRVEADGIEVNGERAHLIVGLIGGKERVTNTVQVALEQELSALVHRASRTQAGAVSSAAFERAVRDSGVDFGREFGDEQRAAERFAHGGGLVFLEGVAGVGKTKAVLPPAVLAWKAEGRHVIGISQAWRQADELKASELGQAGVHETVAISPFLDGVRDGSIKVDANTVPVIDEAAQLGPRQFLEVMRLWRDTGCTVRGMGDGEQCQSIEAGSAVEIMVRNMPPEALPKLLHTVRQKSDRAREIAGLFRGTESPGASLEAQQRHHLAEVTRALDMKREDGHARLIEGDYDQVVGRIAEHYITRRDILRQAGNAKGITISALTNADAAEISKAVRTRLKGRGEIGADEVVYAATNNRGETYDLAVAVGDRFRLYKKTAARIDGARGFIGANGDVVTVRGWWEKGLVLEDKSGRIGHVEWRRITDRDTGRLLLGYGHCLTVDAAQGITSAEHINALPRGSAGITAFKGYVAESRHERIGWTFISRAAETQAELASRPLGDPTEVTDEQVWHVAARRQELRGEAVQSPGARPGGAKREGAGRSDGELHPHRQAAGAGARRLPRSRPRRARPGPGAGGGTGGARAGRGPGADGVAAGAGADGRPHRDGRGAGRNARARGGVPEPAAAVAAGRGGAGPEAGTGDAAGAGDVSGGAGVYVRRPGVHRQSKPRPRLADLVRTRDP